MSTNDPAETLWSGTVGKPLSAAYAKLAKIL